MNKTIIKTTQGTILWVEDEADLREILTDELEDAGYTVIQAEHGQDALRQLEHCHPDLILCDIAMPVMDGYELLRFIRETLDNLADVPFVFLSAQDGSGQITQGKYAGADDYLVKPVNFDLMLATIAARLRQVQRVRDKLADHTGQMVEKVNISHQISNKPFHSLSRMFNLITSGVVLLDRHGKIQFANTAAQRLLFDCIDPIAKYVFNFACIATASGLSTLIRDAIQASQHKKEYTEFLSIPRMDGQRDLLMTVCALDCTGSYDINSAVALFISASGSNDPVPVKVLNSLFNLTPTESRIAWAFVQGMRPDKIAETFAISLTTVAFHKRNIFQKTNTNRQADLIALLLTLPASITQECDLKPVY